MSDPRTYEIVWWLHLEIMGDMGGFQLHINESMSKSSMLVSIFKCRLWMAWESRLWKDLIYFAPPENSGKTVQARRLILLPEQQQKMVFVQLLWSSHNICNNLQSSWVLTIKVEESTRRWLFFARTVFFQNWAPRKSHFLHSHTLVQLQTLCWWWFSHTNETERWRVLGYRVKF